MGRKHLTSKAAGRESPADLLGRPLRDLRISVTDRCNFRCVYCMPKDVFSSDYPFLGRDEILTFEEIKQLADVFFRLGVRKIRLTGGEPLVRKEVERLVASLAGYPGIELTMTTNGSLLSARAHDLKRAGLMRVSVSLDALDDDIFKGMNDVDFGVGRVLQGIDAARMAGLEPVKVNMVVKRGVNDGEILPMAEYFREKGHILRFIEYMDVGSTNGWRLDQVVPASEIHSIINRCYPLDAIDRTYAGEVATRYRYQDGRGEIGLISSVTQAFCGECTRARLSADGKLFTCLFSNHGFDLKTPLREGASTEDLLSIVTGIWDRREDRYSEVRSENTNPAQKVEMSYIGG
jgi:cyclic pyranopterin phosphate synthase